jgi:hypothetical protein
MGQDKKTPITINNVEYSYEDLTAEQQTLFNHCVDLDRKIGSAQFNLDQLNVGKNAFIRLLEESLASPVEQAEVEVVQ